MFILKRLNSNDHLKTPQIYLILDYKTFAPIAAISSRQQKQKIVNPRKSPPRPAHCFNDLWPQLHCCERFDARLHSATWIHIYARNGRHDFVFCL